MKSITKNKAAYHDHQIDKTYDVGIVLKWHEVKAIKMSHVNIKDAIVQLTDKELWIINMDVPLYARTAPVLAPWYQPKWRRKLLITKLELRKIASAFDKSGTILIPLEVYISKRGLIKLTIGVGKLMRKVEKKQILKEKDMKRQMDRDIKSLK